MSTTGRCSSSTSGRAASAPRSCAPTARSRRVTTASCCPTPRPTASCEFDAARARRHVPRARRAPRSPPTGPVDAVGISQPARLDRRVGPRDRRAGRSRARLAGPAHDRRVPRRCGPTASASARTSRRPRCSGSSTSSTTARARPTSASAPSTRGSRGRCRTARVHVTDATNAAITGMQTGDASAWDETVLDRARHRRSR